MAKALVPSLEANEEETMRGLRRRVRQDQPDLQRRPLVANWITLTGVKPYDGRYELDLDSSPLTMREWGWIKRNTGYLPATLTGEAFTDPELITMLAIIAIHRAGTHHRQRRCAELWDRFADVPFGSTITLEADPDEDDAGPPAPKKTGSPSTSGASSPTGSETSDDPRRATGSPRSATSESAPPTLVS